ncbi:pirin family protein [Rhizobium sp. LjRoot254]|uniref:pirin family protein n=1 Tax=Rhizobium sp. LjRoot254 TaxID=3342297 RepID=UPI003ECE5273
MPYPQSNLADPVISELSSPAISRSRQLLPSLGNRMVGPFVFLEQLGPTVFEAGQGFDMRPHPHVGLAAVTYLIDGELVHRDSLGSVETIRPGEVNWMTSGSGIVHSERTSSASRLKGGAFLGVQAWVALPSSFEGSAPNFTHHGLLSVPRTCAEGVEFTLIAGQSDGLISPVQTLSEMVLADIVLTSGARYQVKPDQAERAIYVMAGELEIVGRNRRLAEGAFIVLPMGRDVVLKAPAFHSARILLMGGEPFPEPRYMYWNFVSSSADRIEQAKSDWRRRLFHAIAGDDEWMPLPPD